MADFVPLTGETHHSVALGAGALTLSLPLHAQKIMIQALAQNIRYTLEGTAPAAASGFQLKAGDPPRVIELTGNNRLVLKVIRETSGAILEYEYGE
ncbi:MAG: hypothetical protein EHM33_30215 [Chloroflexi bacterium]|nr:MAG: hypothetical protein EHM33_30215 [Chloroflexota bacterium]